MKRVIKLSKAWIAAFAVGMVLTGCGGGSASTSGTASAGSSSADSDTGHVVDAPVAVLSWSAPSTRVNGERIPMGELDRYVIRYGQDRDNLDQTIFVDNAATDASMSYTVDGLGKGDWFFTIQVQDNKGLISEPSDIVSKQIRA
jgi:hypothetical protein